MFSCDSAVAPRTHRGGRQPGEYYAFSPSWAPDPGNYRRSLWERVGLPNGRSTWDELLEGGARIRPEQGVQLGIGMSQESDSNMAARALIWSLEVPSKRELII